MVLSWHAGILTLCILSIAIFVQMEKKTVVKSIELKPLPKEKFLELRETSIIDESTKADFSVVSYNILAQVYTRQELFPWCPHQALREKFRKANTMSEISALDADFVCSQEMDFYDIWESHFSKLGYKGVYQSRTGTKKDGCAIFYKSASIQLIEVQTVQYNDIGNQRNDKQYITDNIGIMAKFTINNHTIAIANTHLFWNPTFPEVKYEQMKYFIEKLELFNKENFPVILAGDLNSMPDSSVYQLIVNGFAPENHVDFHKHKLELKDFIVDKELKSEEEPKEGSRQHRFQFQSCYGNYREGEEPKDREPEYTNYQKEFNGTLDYIFYDKTQLRHISLLKLPKHEDVTVNGFLPNSLFSSDHLSLKSTFSFVNKN